MRKPEYDETDNTGANICSVVTLLFNVFMAVLAAGVDQCETKAGFWGETVSDC